MMAEKEWHNREERHGLHDKIPWTTGWIAGFLTPNKPDWSKEHDATIARTPPQQPKESKKRCVLTAHEVQSIKDLVFIVGGNSESSAQKAIFEILADNMRDGSRQAREDAEALFSETTLERVRRQAREEYQQRIDAVIKELKEADETSDFYECGVHVKEAIALLQAGRK